MDQAIHRQPAAIPTWITTGGRWRKNDTSRHGRKIHQNQILSLALSFIIFLDFDAPDPHFAGGRESIASGEGDSLLRLPFSGEGEGEGEGESMTLGEGEFVASGEGDSMESGEGAETTSPDVGANATPPGEEHT